MRTKVNITEIPSRAAYLNTVEIGGLTPKEKKDRSCDKAVIQNAGGDREGIRGGR